MECAASPRRIVEVRFELPARTVQLICVLTMKDNTARVRAATASDLVAINDIYNHYVLHSNCTYQEAPEPLSSRRHWFGLHGDQHPVTVAELEGLVVGWGSLSPYNPRSAYRHTVENSVYIHQLRQRRGIGTLILQDLIQRARELGHHTIIAGIDAEQSGSLALHARFQFEKVGHFKQVGFKFGRWLDVIYMALILDDSRIESPPMAGLNSSSE